MSNTVLPTIFGVSEIGVLVGQVLVDARQGHSLVWRAIDGLGDQVCIRLRRFAVLSDSHQTGRIFIIAIIIVQVVIVVLIGIVFVLGVAGGCIWLVFPIFSAASGTLVHRLSLPRQPLKRTCLSRRRWLIRIDRQGEGKGCIRYRDHRLIE